MSKLKCLEHKTNCSEDIILCECFVNFNECLDPVCSIHIKYCEICEKAICPDHTEQCHNCKDIICQEHAKKCEDCEELFCSKCLSHNKCKTCYEEQFDPEEIEEQIAELKILARETAFDAKNLRPKVQLMSRGDLTTQIEAYIRIQEQTREELKEIIKELP